MKPPVGSRVMSDGKSGTVTAHRPGSMVDVRWDDKKYDMRTDASVLSVVKSNPGPRGGLTEDERSHLPESAFALPGRRFPINDRRHAVIAMQYLLRGFVGAGDAPKVLAAIRQKYPQRDLANAEVWAFYNKHRKKLEGRQRMAANPDDLHFFRNGVEDAAAEGGVRVARLAVGLAALAGSSAIETIAKGTPTEQRDRLKRLLAKFRFVAPNTIDATLADPNAFEFLLDFLKDNKAKVHAFIGAAGIAGVAAVKNNPAGDAYDPAKEQFRAVVQGIYESLVRKELGLPYNAAFVSAGGKRLDAPLNDAEKRQLLSRAYAIGTRQGQKYGWLEEGTQTPTAKGRAAAQARLSEQDHAGENRQDYERTLAAVRKGGHFRVVTESVDGQPRFVVQPRPPKELIKIPEYRLSQKAAEQDARAAEAALSKAPKGVRLKANPFYVKDLGVTYTTTDISDDPAEGEPQEGETLAEFEARIGVPANMLQSAGELRGRFGPELNVFDPLPSDLRKKVTKARVIEDFEQYHDIVNADLAPNDPKRGPKSKPKSMPGFINLTVAPGETLEQIMKRGVPRKDLELVKEAMADNVLEHYQFGTFIEPPIREVYYTDPLGNLDREFMAELRDHDQYVEGSSLYSFQGWRDRYRDDFVEGLRAFISLLAHGTMPEGQEALGAKFVFQTGQPEPYNPIPLSELAALPPPAGERAVEAIAKNGANYLKQNLYRLRIPRGLERMLFISPSALRLGVAAGIADPMTLLFGLQLLLVSVVDNPTQEELQIKRRRPKVESRWILIDDETDPEGKKKKRVLRTFVEGTEKYSWGNTTPSWTRGSVTSSAELPPKLFGEYRGALQAEESRKERAKSPRSSETPTRYEAGDTPEMRYRAARVVPPSVESKDDLSIMQADAALSSGKRLLRDAMVLAASAQRNRELVKPDNLEALEEIEHMVSRAAEMRLEGQNRIDQANRLKRSISTASTTALQEWARVPELAARVYSDVVSASNQAAWHFNFYRVARSERGLSAFYIDDVRERADGDIDCQVRTGGLTTLMVKPSTNLTYKFNRREDRDAFVAQFVKPRSVEKRQAREDQLELSRAFTNLKQAIENYKFSSVGAIRGEQTFEEMQFNYPDVANALLRAVNRANAILEKFRVPTVSLPPREYPDEYWEEKVLRDYAYAVKNQDATNRHFESLGGSSLGSLKELTPSEFERLIEDAKRQHDEDWVKQKQMAYERSFSGGAEPLANLMSAADQIIGGVSLTEAERAERIKNLVRDIQISQARYEQQYATEKAAGKHEGKVRGLSADRKDNPSDVTAKKVRDLRSALSILDPSHPEAAAREDLYSVEADRLSNLIDRPGLSTLDEEIIRRSGGVPVFEPGYYAPRQSDLDPLTGVWIPGRYVSSADKSIKVTPSLPSPLELTLDRMERLIAQQLREADSLPYALAIKPTGLNKGLQCGPVVSNSVESVPVLYHDPKAMLPGVKYDAVFADLPTMNGAYPDTVVAFAYLISQPDKGPLMERLRRAFGSPAVQEVTRQHFSMLNAKMAKKLKEAFDSFVSRQAAIFRFPSAAEALAHGKTEAAKKLSVDSRGLPLAAYLYAGIPASEARALAAPPNAAAPIFNGPINLRSALASRQLNSHLNIMAKYPRFPGTESLHRKEDGKPKVFPVPYPPTEESKAKAIESAKHTFIMDSIRVGKRPTPISDITERPSGWTPPFRDERKPASAYPKTWTNEEQMRDLLGQSDLSRRMITDLQERTAAEEFARAAVEQEQIRSRQSESQRADEVAKARNEEAMRGRNMSDIIQDDVLSRDSLLGKADAVDVLAGRDALLRARWFNVIASLRSLLRGKPEVVGRLDELAELANTGTGEELLLALRALKSSLPDLPPKAVEQINSHFLDLSDVVVAAKRSITDPEIEVLQSHAARKVGKAKSVPAPRQKTMIAHEQNMPAVFWDIEYDQYGGADSPELYVLYVDTKRYRMPKFARYLSGDLVRRRVPTRVARSKGGVGGGLGTAGLYGQTKETVDLQNRLAAAKARGDTQEQKDIRRQLNEISRYARDFRAAAAGYVSDLVIEGMNNPLEAIENRLARYSAPSPEQQATGLSDEQKALYRGIAARTGKSYEDLVAMALKRQREAAQAVKSLGRQATGNKDTSWVHDKKFSRIMRAADSVWDPDSGKKKRFGFSIANYARFVTKNPLVLLATIRYWDAPQLVTGMVLNLPGGRTVDLPGVFSEQEGQSSGYALPTDPSALLTELIEDLKSQYLDAVRDNDVVAQAEIIRTLFGHESRAGLRDDDMLEEGLVKLASRFHSATGFTVPSRAEVPAVSGVIGSQGKLSIETGQPVALRQRPNYASDVKIPFKETILGQIMNEDVNLALAEGAERSGRLRMDRAKKIERLRGDSAPAQAASAAAFETEEAESQEEVPVVDTSKAADVPFQPGMRVRMKGGRYSGGTGYVTKVAPGSVSGTKDILILMDPYRNRTSPFEITVNSLAASSLEIIGAAPETEEPEEETRRPSSAETRKGAAGRAQSARPAPEPSYGVGENVFVTVDGDQYVAVITGLEGDKYIVTILRDLTGVDMLDENGKRYEFELESHEISGPAPSGEEFYEGDVVGNPRARRRAQKARANGSVRARLYVASRLMPTVI